MTDISIAAFDTDGAIQETAETAGLDSRADFFRKGLLAGGGVLGASAFGGMVMPSIAGAATPRSDVAILNFALTLEFLEAEFYRQAVRSNFPDAPTNALAKVILRHEAAHVTFLRKALGSKAVKKPKFDFKDTVTNQDKFLQTAFVLENTGVSAYLGQAGRIKTKSILLAAATIVTVEARHSGAVAQLIGRAVSPSGSFDKPKSKEAILRAVKGTGFIVG